MADVRTIAFLNTIKEKLYAGSEFLKYSTSHDSFVKNDKVQIPQAGTIPSVERDRSSFPITVVTRTDDVQEYDLVEYSLGALRVPEKDLIELSYDKVSSILRQHVNKLNNEVALDAIYAWAQAAASVETSGTAKPDIAPPSGTGNRQPLELLDIANAAAKLDEDEVSQNDRFMVVPSIMYWDFVNTNKEFLLRMDYNKGLTNGDISNGVVSMVYGFKMIPRSYTCVYDGSDNLKAVGAAAAATDQWGIVGWQQDEVSKALGAIKVYSEIDSPVYQGNLYSATVRHAASKMRSDGKGVVTIRQDT